MTKQERLEASRKLLEEYVGSSEAARYARDALDELDRRDELMGRMILAWTVEEGSGVGGSVFTEARKILEE